MLSVKARNRRKSYVQFVDTARQLLKHSFAYFKKFPKSATFMITIELADNARKIYSNVVMANSIYPTKQADIDLRYEYLLKAKGHIDVLDGLLSIAKDIYAPLISDYGWLRWGELLSKEKALIKGVIKSDKSIIL